MLERGRTYDEHALDAEVVGHDLGHRDGLDGFPQPHVVADEAATRAGGEERSLALVVVEGHPEEILEGGAPDAARKGFGEHFLPALGVAHLSDEAKRVIVAAQVGIEARRRRQERLELRERLRPQRPAAVEVLRRQTG